MIFANQGHHMCAKNRRSGRRIVKPSIDPMRLDVEICLRFILVFFSFKLSLHSEFDRSVDFHTATVLPRNVSTLSQVESVKKHQIKINLYCCFTYPTSDTH